MARAATDGRWTIVATFYPDELGAERSTIAANLRSCFDDALTGAAIAPATSFDGAQPAAEPARSVTLTIDLEPRPEQLANRITLDLSLEHDGIRWVLQDPLTATIDGSLRRCNGRDGS